ncbi:unnamed protein product [Moneuplotes crassus]|uniref:Uncharacterized protein n=1 Tax=Euplotes crassus TaxID=5936 RepID=A0AAD1Y0Z2_EUPCR|nr:unnamed protein product [Moneuplotes crassus]
MSWGAKARAMDIEPNIFQNSILKAERKRFNLKDYSISDGDSVGGDSKLPKRSIKDIFGNTGIDSSRAKQRPIRYDDNTSTGSLERDQESTLHPRLNTGGFNSSSTKNLTAYDKMRKTVDENCFSHKLLPRSKKLYEGGLIDKHRDFRTHAFESFENEKTDHSSLKYHTPIKSNSSSKFEFQNGLSRLKDNRKSVSINEKFNEIQNYDPEEHTSSAKDGLTSHLRKFLFKELDKMRDDVRKSNSHLSKSISDNEEFYSSKLDDLKRKVKSEIIPASDIQRLVEHTIDSKLREMNVTDNSDNREHSKTQLQVHTLANHFKSCQKLVKELQSDIDVLTKRIDESERKSGMNEMDYDRKQRLVDNHINEVKDDSKSYTDSEVSKLDSRLEVLENKMKKDKAKLGKIKPSNIDNAKAVEPLLSDLRREVETSIRKINSQISQIEGDNDKRDINLANISTKTDNIKKTNIKDLQDLYQRINEIEDRVEDTDMNITKKVNILKSSQVTKATPEINAQAIEGRLERLETISVRHGKLFDEITPNMDKLVTQTNQLKSKSSLEPQEIEEYTEGIANDLRKEFGSKITSLEKETSKFDLKDIEKYTEGVAEDLKKEFEAKLADLEDLIRDDNEAEFREEVFKEIDGIKSAAIEDIKLLDENLKTLANDFHIYKDNNKPCRCEDKITVIEEVPIKRPRSMNRSIVESSADNPHQYEISARNELDRVHQPRVMEKRSISQNHEEPPSSSIVYIGSQKSLDTRGRELNRSNERREISGTPKRHINSSMYSTPSLGRKNRPSCETSQAREEFSNPRVNQDLRYEAQHEDSSLNSPCFTASKRHIAPREGIPTSELDYNHHPIPPYKPDPASNSPHKKTYSPNSPSLANPRTINNKYTYYSDAKSK